MGDGSNQRGLFQKNEPEYGHRNIDARFYFPVVKGSELPFFRVVRENSHRFKVGFS